MTLLTVISMMTKITEITWNVKSHEMSNHNFQWQFLVIIFDDNFLWPFFMTNFDNNVLWWYMIHDTCYMMIKYTVGTNILLNIINIYADVDAISMTPSRNTRSYTLRSVPSSPGRSFFYVLCSMFYVLCSRLEKYRSINFSTLHWELQIERKKYLWTLVLLMQTNALEPILGQVISLKQQCQWWRQCW